MANLREVAFDGRDTLNDVVSMLLLAEKTVSDMEADGEEIALRGTSSLLFSVIDKMKALDKELNEALKGGK